MLNAEQMVKYRKARAEGFRPEQARIQATSTLGQVGVFGKWDCYPGAEETIERDGFTIRIKIEQDDYQDISYLGETLDTDRYQEDEYATIQNETRWREDCIPYTRFESYKVWDSATGMLVDSEPRDVLYFRGKNHRNGGRLVRPENSIEENWKYNRTLGKMGRHAAYTNAREIFLDDCKRISAWANDEWTMTYVTVSVCFEGEELGFASLSGIESDSGYECYNETADELIEEALEEAKKAAPEVAEKWREKADKLVAVAS